MKNVKPFPTHTTTKKKSFATWAGPQGPTQSMKYFTVLSKLVLIKEIEKKMFLLKKNIFPEAGKWRKQANIHLFDL